MPAAYVADDGVLRLELLQGSQQRGAERPRALDEPFALVALDGGDPGGTGERVPGVGESGEQGLLLQQTRDGGCDDAPRPAGRARR